MCGRFVRSFSVDELIEEINLAEPAIRVINHLGHELVPDYNVPPSSVIPVITFVESHVVAEKAKWGFELGDKAQLVINVRSESVIEKPMFRHLLQDRRCAVPMDGFFEWRREGSRKTPFYVHRADSQRMWVAGLWREIGDNVKQVVLMTHESEGVLRDVHHRSPCHLSIHDALEWVTENVPPLGLLIPGAGPSLALHQVTSEVNSVRNNRPDLVSEIDEDLDQQMNLFE
jgi:putative SOS response-associated peptidase YedK